MPADSLAQTAALVTSNASMYVAWVGIALMVALSGIGSAIGTSIDGSASVAAIKKREDIFANCMILSALPGTQGLYGFGAFFLLKTKIVAGMPLLSAMAILAAGLIMGLVALISAIQQAKIVASGIESLAAGNDAFTKTIVLAVYPELYAIIAFAASFLIFTTI